MKHGVRKGGTSVRDSIVEPVLRFLRAETTGGIVLLAAALVALVWANSPLSDLYRQLWSAELALGGGRWAVTEDLRHWVNDGLMTVFFFVVALEIKREMVTGELRAARAAALPALAAMGGVVLPVALFLLIVGGGAEGTGWGIPMATDIAFAVGVLAVLGNRVPGGARVFLLSIAIVDDVIAIAVIAVFYSSTPQTWWLAAAGAGLLTALGMRRSGVAVVWPYAVVGVAVWYATHESGVHATIAGVVMGLLTPARPFRGRDVLGDLERRLHPMSAFFIVPLFALANAGVDLRGKIMSEAAGSPLVWGVAVGLLVGKTLGITLVTLAATRLRLGVLPSGIATRHVWGIAALAGIGFTVSLFIADLAYQASNVVDLAKIGVFAGSLASGVIGVIILTVSGRRRERAREKEAVR
ncbi:Na+/H+ antiporter NhaA [Actinomadura sp. HBU206391]|uniref:Na+/H+ antiporter NhaA n=1 Tax=Actinomadura sp. HBU206391 TaxID=2731692 RepID=UPI00164EEDB0|nr:Na+/H+ antiporter NhaA [Actinomadura sp. HBU206391]MBC6461800.1 Na+/H+ antiporter NhaA [Actinomadura sp. HBU206391]